MLDTNKGNRKPFGIADFKMVDFTRILRRNQAKVGEKKTEGAF